MICKPYHWDKPHANISPLMLITDWLLVMHCSQKTTFHFLSVLNVHTSILAARNHFVGYFWIVTNTFKIYFWDISETSQNKHLFWDMFETSLRGHKKGIFFEIYWRCLKDVSKKISFLRCFWEVFEMSLSMEFCLRHLKDISCQLG